MKQKTKIIIYFLTLVVCPIVIAYLSYYLGTKNPLSWFSDNSNIVSFWALGISILGCFYIYYLNTIYKLGLFWYVVPVFFAIVLIIYYYIGYSFTNFGF